MKKSLAILAAVALVSNFGVASFADSVRSGYAESKRPINMTKAEKIEKAKKDAKKQAIEKNKEVK